MIWWLKGKPVPQVGDLVQYGLDSFQTGPNRWRVASWLRHAPPRVDHGPDYLPDDIREVLGEILYDSCQKIDGHRWQWCLPEEATHVSLTGVCGGMAPIGEVKITGSVKDCWSGESFQSAVDHAMRLGKAHEMIF